MINGSPLTISSQRRLLSSNTNGNNSSVNRLLRHSSDISTKDIKFPEVLEPNNEVEEQTLLQVEFVNEKLQRKARRSELASKNMCLTRRWQTALAIGIFFLALGSGIGGLAYWITLPKVITQPFLLYGEQCYTNSRSCDATRLLWCPDGICRCTGDFSWNTTGQNCSCAANQLYNGIKCQSLGYYGDPCNGLSCQANLMCVPVLNQTYSTGQAICACDNATYLNPINKTCVPRLSYDQVCLTQFDCQDWLGLLCTNYSTSTRCRCDSTSYWNGSFCVGNALGWESCSASIPCDTTRDLTCSTTTNTCECGSLYYWDNVTAIWCVQKKTYSILCEYTFQCNTTVGLSCPTNVSTGCNCPATSYTGICDCQLGKFWDGQRCTNHHSFNGTCPGQYACISNLVCYAGHCICPGNMIWSNVTVNCSCPGTTTWNPTTNTCL